MGTMARGLPLVVVVSASLRAVAQWPRTTPQIENLSAPGAMYPKSSRRPPSGTTAICWW